MLSGNGCCHLAGGLPMPNESYRKRSGNCSGWYCTSEWILVLFLRSWMIFSSWSFCFSGNFRMIQDLGLWMKNIHAFLALISICDFHSSKPQVPCQLYSLAMESKRSRVYWMSTLANRLCLYASRHCLDFYLWLGTCLWVNQRTVVCSCFSWGA